MIDIKDIAKEYQTILGDNFKIKLEADIEPQSDKIQCVLMLSRKPFMVRGIDSESFEVVMQCYAPVNSEMEQLNVMHELSLLTLPLHGEIISNGKTYNYDSFLSVRQPATPQVDTSQFMQLKTLTGAMFITSQIDGAILANDILFDLYELEPIEENEDDNVFGRLAVSNFSTVFTGIDNNPKKMNATKSNSFVSNNTHFTTLQAFLIPTAIHKKLVEFIEGEDTEQNKIWWLKKTYPHFENLVITQKVKIKSDTAVNGVGGGFAEVLLNFTILP